MAVYTSRKNKFKPIKYIKVRLGVASLFCMVTDNLTDIDQSVFFHAPFPNYVSSLNP